MINLIALEKLNTKIYNDYVSDGQLDGWEESDKRFNFYHLFKIAPTLENQSILDVGCGTGEMCKYIPSSTKYLGIDIYRPALKIAKKNFPKRAFKYANILTFKSKPFDYVFCSGALSVNLNGDNYSFLASVLTKMYSLCRKGVAFNVLTNQRHKNSKRSHLYMYNVDKVKKICDNLDVEVKVVDTPLDSYNDQATFYLIRR